MDGGASIDTQWYCPPDVGALDSQWLIERDSLGTYIEANSARTVNTLVVPIHANRNPQTAPAGPPLLSHQHHF